MDIFGSVFASSVTVGYLLLAVGVAIVIGLLFAWIVSFKVRSSKGFFTTLALMPAVVALVFGLITMFLSGTTEVSARIVTLAVALGLVRFRSAQSKADELILLFMAVALGVAFGLGYIFIGCLAGVVLALIFDGITMLPVFTHKGFAEEKLLKVTIPETLEYADVFKTTFDHYLNKVEMVGVKTTGMGSMFRLSYRITMKNPAEEKEMIDELRTKNGNLEISVVPYTEQTKSL